METQTSKKVSLRHQKEYFLIGTIQNATQFDLCSNEGLLCELQIIHDNEWKRVNFEPAIQTQIGYSNPYLQSVIWSRNFEFLFATNKQGNQLPLGIIRVWLFDEDNKLNLVGYSKFAFPLKSGSYERKCPVWGLNSDYKSTQMNWFLGNGPQLDDLGVLSDNSDDLQLLNTSRIGFVNIELNVVKRFEDFNS